MKFTLTYPINSPLIHQPFGANAKMYADPKYGGIKGHNGLDLFSGHGTPVFASHDGIAHFEIDPSGGHGVVIVSDKKYEYKDAECYFKTIYWHLCDGIKEPQFKSPLEGSNSLMVKTGDLIGYADNTGASTGDHLHFGLKPTNWNGAINVEQDNGYLGAIDPSPYFDGSTPATIVNLKKQIFSLQKIVELYRRLLGK